MTFTQTTGSKRGDILGVTYDAPAEYAGRHRAKDGGEPALTLIARSTGTSLAPRRRLIAAIKSALLSAAPQEPPGDVT